MKNVINPWEVKGNIDYKRLMKKFGIEPLSEEILDRIRRLVGELHFMLRRKVFFGHRDLNWLLDKYENGDKFFLYTGRGPSGPLHLGHILTWILTKWFQDKFNVELWFQFTDDEKFLFKNKSFEEIQHWTYENMLDVIALGFNPEKTFFLIDTKNANLLYPEAIKFAKKITFSTVKASFGFTNDRNIGEIFYTSMQAVPAILPSVLRKRNIPCLIPLGIDQDTHFRVARDVYPKLGYYKPALLYGSLLPPLKGIEGKMSTSDEGPAIFTTDSPKEVERKIKKHAFSGGQPTIEEHRKKGGNPEIDVCFQYLRMFLEKDDKKLNEIYEKYKKGDLLTSELKKITIKKINEFLSKHQKERKKAKEKIGEFLVSEEKLKKAGL